MAVSGDGAVPPAEESHSSVLTFSYCVSMRFVQVRIYKEHI